jgi:hypothetical protein
MKKHFYNKIIDTESIESELDTLDLSVEERVHLLSLMESSLHHAILDSILSELSHEDKKIFLRLMTMEHHDSIWQFLNKKVSNIEHIIRRSGDDLKHELHKDLTEAKTKK